MANQAIKKLEEISETMEKLRVQIDDLKQSTKNAENSVQVETMVAANQASMDALAAYQPYQED